jgi:hypothetical protein
LAATGLSADTGGVVLTRWTRIAGIVLAAGVAAVGAWG